MSRNVAYPYEGYVVDRVLIAVFALVAVYHSFSVVWAGNDIRRCSNLETEERVEAFLCPDTIHEANGNEWRRPAPHMPPWTQETHRHAAIIATVAAAAAVLTYVGLRMVIQGKECVQTTT